MSETFDTGPSDTALPPIVNETKAAVLTELSKSEDVSGYLEESKDQALEATGKELSSDRRKLRAERYQNAREEYAQRQPSEATDQGTDHAVDPGSYADHHDNFNKALETRIQHERLAAQHQMRVKDFEREVPDYQDTVQTMFSIFPPNENIAEMCLSSDVGPELAYRLANAPDAIDELNALPEREAARVVGQIERQIMVERQSRMQPQHRPGRHQTQAPAPMSRVNGGASPSRSAADLAKSEDVSALIGSWRSKKEKSR